MEKILKDSEKVLRKLKRIDQFSSKYKVNPFLEVQKTASELENLIDQLPDVELPENQEQLMQAELKRVLIGEFSNINRWLQGGNLDFDSVLALYGVPKADVDNLRPWLIKNKQPTLDCIERIFHSCELEGYQIEPPLDQPKIEQQTKSFATTYIEKYHKKLGKLFQNITNVGEFLRDFDAVPTLQKRSYFHILTSTIAIALSEILFMSEDGLLHPKEKELIRVYGHEGMGHGLNNIVTRSHNLPYFLTRDSSSFTSSTAESLAQFYEKQIFEDLKNSPETQETLDIRHKFEKIYQEALDSRQIEDYHKVLMRYSISVLADKGLGDPRDPETIKKKKELVNAVAVTPTFAEAVVERYKNHFHSQGNLDSEIVAELRYCAQPVQRALDEFKKQGILYQGKDRSLIDKTLLTGFWTPQGYVDNARLVAQEHKKG